MKKLIANFIAGVAVTGAAYPAQAEPKIHDESPYQSSITLNKIFETITYGGTSLGTTILNCKFGIVSVFGIESVSSTPLPKESPAAETARTECRKYGIAPGF